MTKGEHTCGWHERAHDSAPMCGLEGFSMLEQEIHCAQRGKAAGGVDVRQPQTGADWEP